MGDRIRHHQQVAANSSNSRAAQEEARLQLAKERASLQYTESPSTLCELFVPNGYTVDVAHVGMADAHPVSKALFFDYAREISAVFIAPQYVTVTKLRHVEWEPKLSWSINSLLSRYAANSMGPILPDGDFLSAQDDLEVDVEKDSEVMQCVKELLKEQVRPMIMADGGDLRLVNLNEVSGVLSLRLLGACRSCPSSENTLKNGIERVLQHFLPEIKKVVEVKGNLINNSAAINGGIDLDNASLFESVHLNEKSAFQEIAQLDRKRRQALKGRTASGRYTDFDSLSEPDGDDDDDD
jgi:Fe-S cluster biogenesis protein NfuA